MFSQRNLNFIALYHRKIGQNRPNRKLVYKRHLPIFSQFLVKPKQEKNLKISLGFPQKSL